MPSTVQSDMVRAFAEREGISYNEARRRISAVHSFWQDWLMDGNSLKLRGLFRVDLKFDAPKERPFLVVHWCRGFLRDARARLQQFSWDRAITEERDPWRRYTD